MKKMFLTVLAVVFLATYSVAAGNGEINIKAGLEIGNYTGYMAETEPGETAIKPPLGFNFAAEFLYPVSDIVKLGAGAGYLVNRKMNSEDKSSSPSQFGIIPFYFAVQINPIESLKEIFFKANLGYASLTFAEVGDVKAKGGFMYGIETGYEFPFGLLFSLDYTWYNCGIDFGDEEKDFNYGKFGINAGYKFKL